MVCGGKRHITVECPSVRPSVCLVKPAGGFAAEFRRGQQISINSCPYMITNLLTAISHSTENKLGEFYLKHTGGGDQLA